MKEDFEKLKCNEGLAKPSSPASKSTNEVKIIGNSSISILDDAIFVGSI